MASRVVITGYIGTGTVQDPYRPDVNTTGVLKSGTLKLRGDPAVDANALCVTILDYSGPSPIPTRAAGGSAGRFRDLGEDTDQVNIGAVALNFLSTELGITIPTNCTVGELVVLVLGSELLPELDGMIRVRINGHLLREQPVIQGGATDPFTYSDGALDTVSSG